MDYYTFVYDSGNVRNKNVQSNSIINLRKDIRTLDFIPLINYDQAENESNKENYLIHNDGLGMSIRSNMTTVKSSILSTLKSSNIDNLTTKIDDDNNFVDFIKFEFLKYYTNNCNKAENKIYEIKSIYESGDTADIEINFVSGIKSTITNTVMEQFLQFNLLNALEIERFVNIQNYIKNGSINGKKIVKGERTYEDKYSNIKYLFEPNGEEDNEKRRKLISGIRNEIKQNVIPTLEKTISTLNNDENLYSILLKFFIIKKINNINITNYVTSENEREIATKYQIQSIVNNNNVVLENHDNLIQGFYVEKKSVFNNSTNYDYKDVKKDNRSKPKPFIPINAFTLKNDILKFYLYNAVYNGYQNVLNHILLFKNKLVNKKIYQTNIIGDKDAGEKVTGYYNIDINNTSLNYGYQLYPIKSTISDNVLNMFFIQLKIRNYMLTQTYHSDMERRSNSFLEKDSIQYRDKYINPIKETGVINELLYNKKNQIIQSIESYRANTVKMMNQIKGKKPLKLFYVGLKVSTVVPDKASDVDTSPYDGKIVTSFKEKDKICTDSENRFRKLLDYLSSVSSNKILDPNYQTPQDKKGNDKDKDTLSKSFRDKMKEDGQKISDFISYG